MRPGSMAEPGGAADATNGTYLLSTLTDDTDSENETGVVDPDDDPEYQAKTLKRILELRAAAQRAAEDEGMRKKGVERLEEYLVQIMLKLDNVDVRSDAKLRGARKSAILYTQEVLDGLEAAPVAQAEEQTTEDKEDRARERSSKSSARSSKSLGKGADKKKKNGLQQ